MFVFFFCHCLETAFLAWLLPPPSFPELKYFGGVFCPGESPPIPSALLSSAKGALRCSVHPLVDTYVPWFGAPSSYLPSSSGPALTLLPLGLSAAPLAHSFILSLTFRRSPLSSLDSCLPGSSASLPTQHLVLLLPCIPTCLVLSPSSHLSQPSFPPPALALTLSSPLSCLLPNPSSPRGTLTPSPRLSPLGTLLPLALPTSPPLQTCKVLFGLCHPLHHWFLDPSGPHS